MLLSVCVLGGSKRSNVVVILCCRKNLYKDFISNQQRYSFKSELKSFIN